MSCHKDAHQKIAAYWSRHDFIWGKFLEASAAEFGNAYRPIQFGETRYASWFSVIERNIKLKAVYKSVVNDREVSLFVQIFITKVEDCKLRIDLQPFNQEYMQTYD